MKRHIVEFVRPDLSIFENLTYTEEELETARVSEARLKQIILNSVQDHDSRRLVAPSVTRFFLGSVMKVSKAASDLAQFSTLTPRVVPLITPPSVALDIVWEDPSLPSGLFWRSPKDSTGNRVLSWTMQFKNDTRGVTEVAEATIADWLKPEFSAVLLPEHKAASYMLELVLKVLALSNMGAPADRMDVLDDAGVEAHGLKDHSGLRTGTGKAIWFKGVDDIDTPENRYDAELIGKIDGEPVHHALHGPGINWIYTLPARELDGIALERRIVTAKA